MTLSRPGGILLVSTYELGHAPHALAVLAGFLRSAGFDPISVDLSVSALSAASLREAQLIVFSTPMHTALRLALAALEEVREHAPSTPIAFVGHYAALHRKLLKRRGVNWIFAGEHETQFTSFVSKLAAGEAPQEPVISLRRQAFPAPRRNGIADLSRYARFVDSDGSEHLAGYAETTRGCLESCRHCPVPAVYGGRFVAIDSNVVLNDIAAQVDAGAKHITFGDPDFLNGPTHSLRIARELAKRWPSLTFDFTAQVANLLEHRQVATELTQLGCAFAVTAIESLSDVVLTALGKRHRAANIGELAAFAQEIGLPLRPTLVPFTPWTTLDDIAKLTEWIASGRLERHVAPVQITVRLLVPPGSLLLESHRSDFGPLVESELGHQWKHCDSRVDALASELATIVRTHESEGQDDLVCHDAIARAVEAHCGLAASRREPRVRPFVPRVSEPWFC